MTSIDSPGPFVCARCGCLCDDLDLTFRDGKVASAARACAMGEEWLKGLPEPVVKAIWKGGATLPLDKAIAAAAESLKNASAPALAGLTALTVEAQREAARLAEKLCCPLLPDPPAPLGPRRSGRWAPELSASLDEVRASADLVIFWRTELARTAPRHLERYSGGALSSPLRPGLGRTLVFLGRPPSLQDLSGAAKGTRIISFEFADDPAGLLDLTLALALRQNLLGVETPESAQALAEAGLPPGLIEDLSAQILKAGRVHFFLGEESAQSAALWDQLQLLAAALYEKLAMGISAMPSPGNARGFEEVVSWQTGLLAPVDFVDGGMPKHRPDFWRSASGIDLVFSLGNHHPALGKLPRLACGPQVDPGAEISFVIPGLDPRLRGRVIRSDGAVLWLCGRPERGLEDPAPAILKGIADRL